MSNFTRTCVIGGVLAAFATPALADVDVPPVTDAPDGQFAVMRGIQGPAGMLAARVLLNFNLSADQTGEPISIAPDIYYSVTDQLQLGLVHQGPMGWQGRPGLGLCLTGEDHGCPNVYDNLGFDAMYGLAFGETHLSLHGSLFFNTFEDPSSASVALGFAGKAHFSPRVALFFDPKVAIEVSDRDVYDDVLYVPLELQFQAAPATTVKLLTGLAGGLSAFGDTYQIPLGIGLMQNLTRHVDLGARFSFDNLLGNQPDGVGAADARSLAVLLNLRT